MVKGAGGDARKAAYLAHRNLVECLAAAKLHSSFQNGLLGLGGLALAALFIIFHMRLLPH